MFVVDFILFPLRIFCFFNVFYVAKIVFAKVYLQNKTIDSSYKVCRNFPFVTT